jgi:hypothetical protein
VLVGNLGQRVDPVALAAPPDLGAQAIGLDLPLAAGARHRGEEVRRMRQLYDVQAAGGELRGDGLQVPDQVI